MLRIATPIACMLSLSGCSYSYEVHARVANGRLMFDANPQWGADCVREVKLTVGADVVWAKTEVLWQQSVSHDDSCDNRFPIVYGELLRGRNYVYPKDMAGKPASSVAAKKLRTGVVYMISTTTGATGYGCGRFRINANREVQNFDCS